MRQTRTARVEAPCDSWVQEAAWAYADGDHLAAIAAALIAIGDLMEQTIEETGPDTTVGDLFSPRHGKSQQRYSVLDDDEEDHDPC